MIKKAVILAGGLGTRFLPLTKAFPKEMLPIGNKPALQYIVKEIEDAGIKDIAILINNDKEAVRRYFSPAPDLERHLEKADKPEFLKLLREISTANIEFFIQHEPLGSGHAVMCVRDFAGRDDIALLNGDDLMYSQVPVTRQVADCFTRYGKTVIGVQPVPQDALHKYGVVSIKRSEGRTHFIDRIIEKPKPGTACSNLASMGRYILKNEIFDILADVKPGANNEIPLTDALDVLIARGEAVAYDFEARRYDLGGKQGYLEANIEFGLRDPDTAESLAEFIAKIK